MLKKNRFSEVPTDFFIATYLLATVIEGGCGLTEVEKLKQEKMSYFFQIFQLISNVSARYESTLSPVAMAYVDEIHFILKFVDQTGVPVADPLKEISKLHMGETNLSPLGRNCFRAIGLGMLAGFTIDQSLAFCENEDNSCGKLRDCDLSSILTEQHEQSILTGISILKETGGNLSDFLLFVTR